MSRRAFRWALFLTLALSALGFWRFRVASRRERDRELFQAYVDGALDDYAMAVTRALPALEGNPKAADLADAKASASASVEELKSLMARVGPGWLRSRLEYVEAAHQRAAAMIAALPVAGKNRKAWLAEEAGLRQTIVAMLEDVRYETSGKWKISQSQFLELNALIYSLKEAQEAAKPGFQQ
jgi:hypothetical protein